MQDELCSGLETLMRAEAYPHDSSAGEGVSHAETHGTHLFFTEDYVYKFRKAVDRGFLDFRERSERNVDYIREVVLNQRLAPGRGRRRLGLPVDGHGDLRLEHVFFEEPETPLVIDCIEFDAGLRQNDPGNDLGFLTMDLHSSGTHELAGRFLQAYAREADDFSAYAVVDHFAAYAAAVRAKVRALRVPEADAQSRPTEVSDPEVLHTRRLKDAVYAGMLARAEPIVATGRGVVLDATFSRARWCEQVRSWARKRNLALVVVETRCPPAVVLERFRRRKMQGDDSSDAGPEHYRTSVSGFEPIWRGVATPHIILHTDRVDWMKELADGLGRISSRTAVASHEVAWNLNELQGGRMS
jgi:predicted kinase